MDRDDHLVNAGQPREHVQMDSYWSSMCDRRLFSPPRGRGGACGQLVLECPPADGLNLPCSKRVPGKRSPQKRDKLARSQKRVSRSSLTERDLAPIECSLAFPNPPLLRRFQSPHLRLRVQQTLCHGVVATTPPPAGALLFCCSPYQRDVTLRCGRPCL